MELHIHDLGMHFAWPGFEHRYSVSGLHECATSVARRLQMSEGSSDPSEQSSSPSLNTTKKQQVNIISNDGRRVYNYNFRNCYCTQLGAYQKNFAGKHCKLEHWNSSCLQTWLIRVTHPPRPPAELLPGRSSSPP